MTSPDMAAQPEQGEATERIESLPAPPPLARPGEVVSGTEPAQPGEVVSRAEPAQPGEVSGTWASTDLPDTAGTAPSTPVRPEPTGSGPAGSGPADWVPGTAAGVLAAARQLAERRPALFITIAALAGVVASRLAHAAAGSRG